MQVEVIVQDGKVKFKGEGGYIYNSQDELISAYNTSRPIIKNEKALEEFNKILNSKDIIEMQLAIDGFIDNYGENVFIEKNNSEFIIRGNILEPTSGESHEKKTATDLNISSFDLNKSKLFTDGKPLSKEESKDIFESIIKQLQIPKNTPINTEFDNSIGQLVNNLSKIEESFSTHPVEKQRALIVNKTLLLLINLYMLKKSGSSKLKIPLVVYIEFQYLMNSLVHLSHHFAVCKYYKYQSIINSVKKEICKLISELIEVDKNLSMEDYLRTYLNGTVNLEGMR